jgi:hypothetical protein
MIDGVTAEQMLALKAEMKSPSTSRQRKAEIREMRRAMRELVIDKIERKEWTVTQGAKFMGYTGSQSLSAYVIARRPIHYW